MNRATRSDCGALGASELVPFTAPINLSPFGVVHPRPYLCRLAIGRQHLGDVIEHVSNIEYVRWLDRAAELHADSLGFPRSRLMADGVMWFVARHEIDYLAEAWLGDDLVLATWVRDFAKVKSWRDYLIVRPRDSAVICRAATLWVLVDLTTRRPTRIPAGMSMTFDALSRASSDGASHDPSTPCTSA